MSLPTGASCPFHSKPSSASSSKLNYSAAFEDPHKRSRWILLFEWIKDMLSRCSISSIRNVWRIFRSKDLNSAFAKAWKKDQYITDFHTPKGAHYLITDPAILQLMNSHFRNHKNGLFSVPDNERIFIDITVKDLFPEEVAKVSDREKELLAAVFFTAEPADVSFLRSLVANLLKQKAVEQYREEIDAIAGDLLDDLPLEEQFSCDIASLASAFALSVASELFTGYKATRKKYEEISSAMTAIIHRAGKKALKQSLTREERIKYQSALESVRNLLENSIKSEGPLIVNLKNKGCSDLTIKIYLFFFYFAATDTPGEIIHYLLLQLGHSRNKDYQKIIRKDVPESLFLKKCITEALRLHPPVYHTPRLLSQDKLVTLRGPDNVLLWSKLLRKGHYLVGYPYGTARDPRLYTHPDLFNPLRFDTIPTVLPWLPFSVGPHTCPGQFLARTEIESFVKELLKRYEIQNIPDNDFIETQGMITLEPDPKKKIKIRLARLQRESEKSSTPHP